MQKKDYLETQIEALSKTFAALFFGKKDVREIFEQEEESEAPSNPLDARLLELQLQKLLTRGEKNTARRLLQDAVREHPTARMLEVALNFYHSAHQQALMTEEEIEEDVVAIKKWYPPT
jgi:hypothetical protein